MDFLIPDSFLYFSAANFYFQVSFLKHFIDLRLFFLHIIFENLIKYLRVVLDAGPGAVNFILDHAEVDFVFVQDKKVKEVRTLKKIELLCDKMICLIT